MNKKTSTTRNKKDPFKGVRDPHNTLGMEKEEYEKYKADLIQEYADNPKLSMNYMVNREQEKGIKLYYSRFQRWLRAAEDVEVRGRSQARKEIGEERGMSYGMYVRMDQIEDLKKFENQSALVRMGLDLVLGNRTPNCILFLGEGKNVIFIDNQKKERVEAYVVGDLTKMEKKVVQTLINKANEYGTEYIAKFAIENELKYYGANEN